MKQKEITIAIHQPGYHRYLGYFYKMLISDVFISLDTVQYVPREWQNRQKFMVNGNEKWLSIPVGNKREQILNKQIINPQALTDHWEFINYLYHKTPYFNQYRKLFESVYTNRWHTLNDFCTELILYTKKLLGIKTLFVKASSIDPYPSTDLKKADLLIYYIKQFINTEAYDSVIYHPRSFPLPKDFYLLHKHGDSSYTEIEKFERADIKVKPYVFNHPKYEQYQNPGVFYSNMSIVDLLFNTGPQAITILKNSGNKNDK